MDLDNNIETTNEPDRKYFIWKKNTPFLYDVVISKDLTWPSLTVEWLPDIVRQDERDFSLQRLIIGTQNDGSESNYLAIIVVKIPNRKRTMEIKHYNNEKDEFGGYGLVDARIDISIKINHEGTINRARYLPQCPNVIATKTENPDILIFDYTRHPSQPDSNGKCKPDLVLKGHSNEGYGLSWCIKKPGILLSCAKDKTIQLWDLNDKSSYIESDGSSIFEKSTILNSYQKYDVKHSDNCCVEDVGWHKFSSVLFGSVCNDGNFVMWDSRINGNQAAVSTYDAEGSEMLSMDFSPFNEYLVITGHQNGNVSLWDLRFNKKKPLRLLKSHTEPVTKVEWSPHRESLLASSSYDKQLLVWDLKKLDFNETPNPLSKELVFRHMGHSDTVMDFSWNRNVNNMFASVSYDNIVQIWQPDRRFFV